MSSDYFTDTDGSQKPAQNVRVVNASAGTFVAAASVTNGSSTITLGGTAQTALAAGTSTNGWLVQNQSSDYLYVRQTTTATADQNAIRIAPGAMYVADYLTGGLVSIIGPTTGQAFTAKGW